MPKTCNQVICYCLAIREESVSFKVQISDERI